MDPRNLKVLGTLASAGAQSLLSAYNKSKALGAIRTLASLRGPFVKLIQSVALFPELLPEHLQGMESVVFDNVPPMGQTMALYAMQAALGRDWRQHFETFHPQATFAASFGQVHKAVLRSGEQCAVKLQYPKADEWLKKDLRFIERFLAYRYKGAFDLASLIEDVRAKLAEELDYDKERRSMEYFSSLVCPEKLSIPRVFTRCSTKSVLCMEWIDGQALDGFVEHATQKEKDVAAQTLFSFWMESLCLHHVVHGDPHFGNYRFHPGGKVSLLDFGSVLTLPGYFIKATRLLYEALRKQNTSMVQEACEIMGFRVSHKAAYESIYTWAQFLFQPLLRQGRHLIYSPDDTDKGRKLFRSVIDDLRQYDVVIPKNFLWFDRVIMSLGAVMFVLQTRADWGSIFEQFLYDGVQTLRTS